MLTLDLVRLSREGTADFEGEIPADDSIWAEIDGEADGGLVVRGGAQLTSTGQLVVRGSMKGSVQQKCRRCLDPVQTEIRETLDLVWAPEDSVEPEDDGELRTLDSGERTLDLLHALREEVLLRVPAWVLCSVSCRGLCPRCGVDLNHETCDCSQEERDPRWDALRGLQSEERK